MARKSACFFLTLLLFISPVHFLKAVEITIPAWFELSAILENPPEVQKPVRVLATLTAPLGDLREIDISLHIPPQWGSATPTDHINKLEAGHSHLFTFLVQPDGPIPNGSIGCSFSAKIPKESIYERLRTFPNAEREHLIKTVSSWPSQGHGYSDIAFALFQEEGFYPLGSDMWLEYDERLAPSGGFKGPSFYCEPLISPHLAQNDVEMYEKLHRLLETDASLSALIQANGVNVEQKRRDFLTGLYVLAVEAYLKGSFSKADAFLNRMQAEFREVPEGLFVKWRILALNIQGLSAWAKGNKKGAEALLRDAFYKNRKLPEQRYILRNLGLLTLEMGNPAMAREMFRLALELKPTYSLLKKEHQNLK